MGHLWIQENKVAGDPSEEEEHREEHFLVVQ